MAQKNYYYVAVIKGDKIRLVTSLKSSYAEWGDNGTPKRMTKKMANDIAFGLMLNGFKAYTLSSQWEIERQFKGLEVER